MKEPILPTRSIAQRATVLLAVFVQIGSTFLPALGLGDPIGDRSDAIRTLITPSGWAFAIWGPLFFGSALFAIWQALPGQRSNQLAEAIAWPAALALAAQGVWATYTQFDNLTAISVLIILTSLGGLLACLRILTTWENFTAGERFIAGVTFSALAAWLTAASIVNVSAALAYYGVGGDFVYPLAAAVMIAIGGAIAACAILRSRGNPWYAAVFLWALTAIYFRGGQEALSIAYASIAAGALVIAGLIAGLKDAGNRKHWLGF